MLSIISFIIISNWSAFWGTLPSQGLDPSWLIGLNIAYLKNFQFGKDIIFTFGPLGFLWIPVIIDYNLWMLSTYFSIFTDLILIFSMIILFNNLSAKYYHYLILVPIILFSILPNIAAVEYKLCITSMILIYIVLIKNYSFRVRLLAIMTSGLLLSIATLIKFNAFL